MLLGPPFTGQSTSAAEVSPAASRNTKNFGCVKLKAFVPDPEGFSPGTVRPYALQVVVLAIVSQVQRVGDGCHGFEAHELLTRRRVHQAYLVLRSIHHLDLVRPCFKRESSLAVTATNQISESVVEGVIPKRNLRRQLIRRSL